MRAWDPSWTGAFHTGPEIFIMRPSGLIHPWPILRGVLGPERMAGGLLSFDPRGWLWRGGQAHWDTAVASGCCVWFQGREGSGFLDCQCGRPGERRSRREGKGEKAERCRGLMSSLPGICLALVLKSSHSDSAEGKTSFWEEQRPLDLSVSDSNAQTPYPATPSLQGRQ